MPSQYDLTSDAKVGIDGGAVGAFVIGNVGDHWARAGRTDLIGKVVDFISETPKIKFSRNRENINEEHLFFAGIFCVTHNVCLQCVWN